MSCNLALHENAQKRIKSKKEYFDLFVLTLKSKLGFSYFELTKLMFALS